MLDADGIEIPELEAISPRRKTASESSVRALTNYYAISRMSFGEAVQHAFACGVRSASSASEVEVAPGSRKPVIASEMPEASNRGFHFTFEDSDGISKRITMYRSTLEGAEGAAFMLHELGFRNIDVEELIPCELEITEDGDVILEAT